MPKVSIIIPCYNHGEFLLETLDSIQEQTFTEYEIIIIDDGSTDVTTVKLLRNLKRPKTTIFHTDNCGVSAARNRGIAEAKGSYILPLDADDKIGSTYLESAVKVLETRPEVAVVYCERMVFGEREGLDPLPDYDARSLLIDNCICPAAFFRKTDWQAVGGYSEKMVYSWEDWDFWISLSELNKLVVKIPEPLFFYRVRGCSRDHSLRFYQKFILILVMILRHKKRYLCNLDLLVNRLFTLLNRRLFCW